MQGRMENEHPSSAAGAASSAGCSAACPLARLPESFWLGLVRRPFRRRHPVIFWLLILLVLLALLLVWLGSRDDAFGGPRLAVLEVNGTIDDVRPHLEWLRRIARQDQVKGLLVRVDSPGGGAAASQELYEAVRQLGERLPVAVSMGGMAASGGLMVSMAGQRVFANAGTVTGSIGVRMDIPQIRALLDRIGVDRQTLTTAPYKDAGSMLRPLSDEERAYFQGVLDDMHGMFVDIVARGRHMAREQAAALADGRIFTGREALRLGLVDELGGMEAAHRWLAEQSGVDVRHPLLERPRKERWWQDLLESTLSRWLGLDAAAVRNATPVFLYQ